MGGSTLGVAVPHGHSPGREIRRISWTEAERCLTDSSAEGATPSRQEAGDYGDPFRQRVGARQTRPGVLLLKNLTRDLIRTPERLDG